MQSVGIDAISFYTSNIFIDLASIAKVRNIDTSKYYVGLGQHKMAVPAVDEDVVTLAANAAHPLINDSNRADIGAILFATESGIDHSKAAAIFVHELLGLSPTCRAVELKQACYSSTAALQFGLALVRQNPKQKILVIASDIARYGLNTPGEPSQGCGAVAMLLSADPRLMTISPESAYFTQDIMDFWRPNYREEALVEGKYSSKMYLSSLETTWQHYQELTGLAYQDFERFCYHTPVPRLAEKGHKLLNRLSGADYTDEVVKEALHDALIYNRIAGNCYTASLYLSLTSLVDHCQTDLAGQRIGLFSYGSGSVAEFYSGVLQPHYRHASNAIRHRAILENRKELDYNEYQHLYNHQLPKDGSDIDLPKQQAGPFRLAGLRRHKRIYEPA